MSLHKKLEISPEKEQRIKEQVLEKLKAQQKTLIDKNELMVTQRRDGLEVYQVSPSEKNSKKKNSAVVQIKAIEEFINTPNDSFLEKPLQGILDQLKSFDKQMNQNRSGFVRRFSRDKIWAAEIIKFINEQVTPKEKISLTEKIKNVFKRK